MDPEAGTHGSGGWDPWIRRLGPMDPEAGIHGSEPPKPASAGLGRPAGGRGPEVQKERKIVKSSRKCRPSLMTPEMLTQPPPWARFSGPGALIYDKIAFYALFQLFRTFGRFEEGK